MLLSACRMEDLGRISDIRDIRRRETIQYNIKVLERKCALHQEMRLKNFFLAKCTDLSNLKEQAKEREGIRGERVWLGPQTQSPQSRWRGCLWWFMALHPERSAGPLPCPQPPPPEVHRTSQKAEQ